LSQGDIDINSGEMLVEMFEIMPSKRLLTYARKWLHQFPNHQDGPRLMSFWLKHYPSRESYDLSAKFLKRHWPVSELHWLFNSVVGCKHSPRLDRLMEERLEKAPKDDIWSRCLSPYKGRPAFANRLALRWLKLNEDNPELLTQGFTFFAQSPEVVNAIFSHFRKHGMSRAYNEWEIHCILDKARELKLEILPEVIEFSRKWLFENPDDEDYAAQIHASLVRASRMESDIKEAKEWYLRHKNSDGAYAILSCLLSTREDGSLSPDPFAISEAKTRLRTMPADERTPSLVGVLLKAHQDDETIGWAKDVYDRTGLLWILVELLRYAPDPNGIAEGKSKLRQYLHTDIGHELLHVLLDRDPDASVRRCARSWLAKNSKHRCAKKVRKQLEQKVI
jgi:hypothetical protein